MTLPRCQSMASTLTSLSICVTNLYNDLQHVSCLTNLTRLELSTEYLEASQPEALDQMTAQITQIHGLKALHLLDFPHSFTNSVSHEIPNLQELVSDGFGPVLDVQHCTQLTSLTVGDDVDLSGLRQVHLPAGQVAAWSSCLLKSIQKKVLVILFLIWAVPSG